jgi:hypothetical protein
MSMCSEVKRKLSIKTCRESQRILRSLVDEDRQLAHPNLLQLPAVR